MSKTLVLSVLASLLVAAPCMAAEAGMCKSICSEQKRQCRAEASTRARVEVGTPSASMAASPHERARSRIEGTPQDAKAAQQSEYLKRRHEREDLCDSAAMACVRACTPPEPATPKTQQ
jgi:hypothetical protein